MALTTYAKLVFSVLTFLVGTAAWTEQLPLRSYTTVDGLRHNRITCILQDPRGFLWFGTFAGLSRFDGYTFTNYGPEQGLPDRVVSSLAITADGTYWVGSSAGLFRFDPTSSSPLRFELVPTGTSEQSRAIKALLVDHSGVLWIATWDGLYRVEGARHAALQSHDLPKNALVTTSLAEDRSGTLWIAGKGAIYRRTADSHTTAFFDPRFDRVEALYADSHRRLWAGTQAGLFRLDPNAEPGRSLIRRAYTNKDGVPFRWFDALLETSDGSFWAASNGLSFYVPDEDRFKTYTTTQGLSENSVSSLSEDSAGNLWVGTQFSGVIKIAHHGFTSYTQADGLDNVSIRSILVAQTGELCVETPGRASSDARLSLACFDGKRFTSVQPDYPKAIRSFGWGWNQAAFQDHAGEWWVPTGDGLCWFGKASQLRQIAGKAPKAVFTTRDGLPTNNIFRLFEDSRGDIWVATQGPTQNGLARWERATRSFHVYPQGFPQDDLVSALAEDHAGQIWLGGWHGGLARLRDGHFEFYSGSDLGDGAITDLHVDHAGRLWIATYHGGLGRMDSPSEGHPHVVMYTTREGLSSNNVGCITEDQWGRIYACTGRGVDRLDPRTSSVRHYSTADGLTRGELVTAARDRQGALWFGSTLGLSRLVPEVDPPETSPPVFIAGLQVRGVPQPLDGLGQMSVSGLVLEPNENQVRFDFVGLAFATGESLRYQYQLEGADRDWGPPSEQRTVNYANLAPGRYIFRVRALTVDGSATQSPASVSFTVLAPVWRRWWFLASMGIGLSVMLYVLYRYRLAQLLKVERIRIRIATDLHDDIGSSLSQIAILSEVAHRRVKGADPHVSGPLSEIATVSRELVEGMGDIVWAINPRHDRLTDLAHRMRRFAGDVLEARDVDLDFHGPADFALRVGADLRRQVFLIFKEAIHNVARHSLATRVEVWFDVVKDCLLLRIVDNGKGFDPDKANDGNGLVNMRKRALELAGVLRFESLDGCGTTLELRVPLAPPNRGRHGVAN